MKNGSGGRGRDGRTESYAVLAFFSLTTSPLPPSLPPSLSSAPFCFCFCLCASNCRNDNRETKKKWEQMCDNGDKTVSEQTGPPPSSLLCDHEQRRREPQSVSQSVSQVSPPFPPASFLVPRPNYEFGTVVNRQKVLSSPGIPRKAERRRTDISLGKL